MAEETKVETAADEFALTTPDGKLAYPRVINQQIENNKVVSCVVVNTPEEHKKWLKDNSPAEEQPKEQSKTPAWGKK